MDTEEREKIITLIKISSWATNVKCNNIANNLEIYTGWHTKTGRKVNAYNSKTARLRNMK